VVRPVEMEIRRPVMHCCVRYLTKLPDRTGVAVRLKVTPSDEKFCVYDIDGTEDENRHKFQKQ
jgi:hypothetical protein